MVVAAVRLLAGETTCLDAVRDSHITNILRTLDRRSTRDFHKDLVDGLRPWMYWLELPLALSNAGLNYALKPINLPDIAAGATGWILVFATPFVLLGCTSCLWCARLLRIPVERRFDIGSFNRALLAVSVASYAMAAALGAVGSVVLPDVFLV